MDFFIGQNVQIQENKINPQMPDTTEPVREVKQLLRLQAKTNHVYLNSKIDPAIYIYAY
jgi:hypothetical protein